MNKYICVEYPTSNCEYFKLTKGESFTPTSISLERSYILIISRVKHFIREFGVRAKIAVSLPDYMAILSNL